MVTKLFSMYPVSRGQNLDLAIEGYVEALLDTPWPLVSLGIAKLVEDPALTFAPPAGKIREAAALVYHRGTRTSDGWNVHGGRPNIARLLASARRQAGMPELPSGERIEIPVPLEASVSRIGKRMPE